MSVLIAVAAIRKLIAGQISVVNSQQKVTDVVASTWLGRRDSVTGLANRHAFSEAVSAQLAAGKQLILLVIHIDGLRVVNNHHGLRVADEVLQGYAQRLRHWLRHTDAAMACLGGDDLAVLLETQAGREEAEARALDAIRTLGAPLEAGGRKFDMRLCIGVALAPLHGRSSDQLMRAGQYAVDRAKLATGPAWCCFEPPDENAMRKRRELCEDLPSAIASGELVPYYHPIIELSTGQVVSLEVVARWEHPSQGQISPQIFQPLVEELQLASALTFTLINQVGRDAHFWPREWRFSFKASPNQLRELISIAQNPSCWGNGILDPARIDVEVTDSALLEDLDVARSVFAALQSHRAHVALDHFGLGIANFVHLRELTFNRIKIDPSFIANIAFDARAEACVRTMLTLGRSLEIDMVAAGIENNAQAQRLLEIGCKFGQGSYFAGPIVAKELMGLRHKIRALAQPAVA